MARDEETLDVAIIGAGFAGLCMAIQLELQSERSFRVFEKASRLGGTWRDNTYPGAACDVPSLLYCYSFERRTDWGRFFAKQPEILDYLEHCAERYGVRGAIRFDTEITEAVWDEAAAVWRLHSADGEVFEARAVVCGTGQLSRPRVPEIPGASDFAGAAFHTARWDHDHDLAGRRVALIGNGASAIQVAPAIAPEVDHLSVFQRSPNWIIPKHPDRALSAAQRWILSHVPLLGRASRGLVYALMEIRFAGLLDDSRVMRRWIEFSARRNLHKAIEDPELRAVLEPDYPAGCKRILISNDYYPTLLRPNVRLVTSHIERMVEEGIVTEDGERHEVDTVVYATGFESTAFLTPMRFVGRGGQVLSERWEAGAEAYLGVTVPGFPNFFILYGPNTNLGHNSIVFMIERQVRHVLQCLDALEEAGCRALEPRPEAMERFRDGVHETLDRTVWSGDCSSWYKNDAGTITNNWPSWTLDYWWQTRSLERRDYRMW